MIRHVFFCHVTRLQDRTKRSSRTKIAKCCRFLGVFLDWIKSLFWREEMELTLVGLQYSGKTTFVNVIAVIIVISLSSTDG